MNVGNKITCLMKVLNFANLKDFADNITFGNIDRAKGLSSGRIKKFNPAELMLLINKYNINENWLLDDEENIFKENIIYDRTVKLDIYNIENRVIDFVYFDKNFLNYFNGDYFVLKTSETLDNKIYLLCRKNFDISKVSNDFVYVFLKKDKLIVKKYNSSLDKIEDIFAKVDKKISVDIF